MVREITVISHRERIVTLAFNSLMRRLLDRSGDCYRTSMKHARKLWNIAGKKADKNMFVKLARKLARATIQNDWASVVRVIR
ncbi:hypothetical protein D9M68_943530 [compost metagenome]